MSVARHSGFKSAGLAGLGSADRRRTGETDPLIAWLGSLLIFKELCKNQQVFDIFKTLQ